ncbi:SHOCT-like domain-containing protein [Oceanithermus sp.]
MDEYAKIAGMLESGRISPEEAEKLLAALDEAEPAAPESPRTGRWLRARLDRADLTVRVDPRAGAPAVSGSEAGRLILEDGEDGWRLRQKNARFRLSFFNLLTRRMSVELTLPPDAGLELRLGQGRVRIADRLPALTASIGQGQLDFAGAEGLDVQLAQGSVSGRARLSGGSHRLSLGMGSLKLALEEGSDLRLQARTGMGEISVTGSLQYAGEKAAARYEGVVGEGRGLLKISVGMGTVEVEVP